VVLLPLPHLPTASCFSHCRAIRTIPERWHFSLLFSWLFSFILFFYFFFVLIFVLLFSFADTWLVNMMKPVMTLLFLLLPLLLLLIMLCSQLTACLFFVFCLFVRFCFFAKSLPPLPLHLHLLCLLVTWYCDSDGFYSDFPFSARPLYAYFTVFDVHGHSASVS